MSESTRIRTAGSAVISNTDLAVASTPSNPEAVDKTGAARQIKGVCPLDCPDTCSWIVTVKNGDAILLTANREHPVTRGALCVKVNKYLDYTRSAERLMYPLRRVGHKGEGRFERISWERALEEIASRWLSLIDRFGPQTIWPYCGDGHFGMLQGLHGSGRRLWNVLGTSQHLNTICSISGGIGTGYTIGDNRMGMDPETVTLSRLIILWGTNTLSTNQHLRPKLDEARRNGAYIVAIDPIRTRTANYADEHIAPIPGTDAALALGLLHVVISLDAQDDEFIRERTLGWESFKARIRDYPPARVADITGIPEDQIKRLGERIAKSRPTAIKISMGMTRHGGGGMAARTITCIPGVTGDWRYPGGGVVYDTRGFFKGNWNALWRDDLRPPGTRTLQMTKLGEALLERKDPPINALLVYAGNPLVSNPAQGKTRAGLARTDLFTVVIEHFHTDTVDYADLVLPGTMQTEHNDLHHAYGHLCVAWNETAVSPPGECLPHSEIFRRLARNLKLTEPCLFDTDEEMARQVLASGHPSMRGITLERLKREGFARLGYPQPFAPFAEGFPTTSGRLEFYCERMERVGLDPVAGYTPPHEAAQRDTELARRFPLAIITPATHHFLNSMFANWPRALRREGTAPQLWMHPDDAAEREIRSNDQVRVFNDRGAFTATLVVTDRVRPGLVASFKGHWLERNCRAENMNATVADRDSDMGGGATFHDNRVQVEKASNGSYHQSPSPSGLI